MNIRPKCLLLWGAVILVPLAVLVILFSTWYQGLSELNARIERDQNSLKQYQTIVATLPALRAELKAEKRSDAYQAFYFAAESAEVAQVRAQSQLQQIIQGAGAQLTSTQALPSDSKEEPPQLRIRAQFQGDTEALLEILHQVESVRPFLFIDQLTIRSLMPKELNNRRRPSRAKLGELNVSLDVSGFVLEGA